MSNIQNEMWQYIVHISATHFKWYSYCHIFYNHGQWMQWQRL